MVSEASGRNHTSETRQTSNPSTRPVPVASSCEGSRDRYLRSQRRLVLNGEIRACQPTPVQPQGLATVTQGAAKSVRDKAITALFAESGLRLSELANIKPRDIDWNNDIIRVIGEGNKEGYAPFGAESRKHSQSHPFHHPRVRPTGSSAVRWWGKCGG
jgi:integrase